MEGNSLKDLLLLGFPIKESVILYWNTPCSELLSVGKSVLEEWKRWEQDRDGHYIQNKRMRLKWNKIQVPGLPSILAADLEYDQPSLVFRKANLYYSDRKLLEKELNGQLGDPYIHRTEFQDKDGINENIQKQWIVRSSDSKSKISFKLDGAFSIEYSNV